MKKYLERKERAAILKELTKEQRETLFKVIGKRHRSYFADVLARYQGTKDWTLFLYIDHGHVRKDIHCECGRPLRHQYILINKKTKEKRTIGSTHLIEELKIPDNIAKEVLQGIHNINYELDELLQKYHLGWELPQYIKKNITKIKVPSEIDKLLNKDLPLLNRHLDLLYSKLFKLNSKTKEKNVICDVEETAAHKSNLKNENKNVKIYNVLKGKTSFASYIKPFIQDIDYFLAKQKRYVPLNEVINYLISKGLPNEFMFGQHILKKHFATFFNTESRYLWKKEG
jgi:hypothetical protein